MPLRKFIRNNLIFSIFSLGFLIWILFLITLSAIAKREVIFLDGLAGVYPGANVSTDYSSVIPRFRYFIEPFTGVAFIIGYDFEWAIAFTLLYLIYRIIYLILKKTGKVKPDKFKSLSIPSITS